MRFPTLPIAKGQLAATCLGAGISPLVTRCDEGSIADLSTFIPTCKINCKGAAKYPAPDPKQYIECFFNGRTWDPETKPCVDKKDFNPKTKKCE